MLRVEAMDNKGEEVMAFAAVAEQMLQDVQQRLCYVVQNYMRTHIQGFTPQPRDIDYPARLTHAPSTRETDDPTATTASGGADAGKTLLNGTGDGGVQHASGGAAVTGAGSVRTEGSGADVGTAAPPAATAASVEVTENGDGVDTTWYPSVSRTIVLLSKLYRSVDKDVFQILSEELVHACLDTLDSAATMVGAKSGKVHAQLFMIKHLLVVREQLSPFDVEMTKTEKILDFGGFLATLRHAATDLLTSPKTSVFADTTGSILSFLQRTTPQILETKEDARQLLEDKLRNACMAFITDTCRKSTTSINSFLVMVSGYQCHGLAPSSVVLPLVHGVAFGGMADFVFRATALFFSGMVFFLEPRICFFSGMALLRLSRGLCVRRCQALRIVAVLTCPSAPYSLKGTEQIDAAFVSGWGVLYTQEHNWSNITCSFVDA